MMITPLRDLRPGQQIILDTQPELVIRHECLGGDLFVLTFHDGRQTIPLPGTLEALVQGAQLSISDY